MARTPPPKPYPSFPLYAHASGQWAKTIRGRKHYFGAWSDPEAAREKYEREMPYLVRGEKPPEIVDGLTFDELATLFLASRNKRREVGEISDRTYDDYRDLCKLIVSKLGRGRVVAAMAPNDFARLREDVAASAGLARVAKVVTMVKMLLKFARTQQLVGTHVEVGEDFRPPSKAAMRRKKRAQPTKIISPEIVRELLNAADADVQAWIVVALNCGYGPTDISELPASVVDLNAARIEWPRPKTGIERVAVLWPETVEVLRKALSRRPAPLHEYLSDRVFLSPRGGELTGRKTFMVTQRFRKLLQSTGYYEAGRSFYSFRHTVETIGGSSRDQVAVNAVMGHGDGSMAEVYRASIEDGDERIKAVCWKVREWLWPEAHSSQ